MNTRQSQYFLNLAAMNNFIDLQSSQNYFVGIDIGTSFIKVSLIDSFNQCLKIVRQPQIQMQVHSQKNFYCQQDPEEWWKNVCIALKKLQKQFTSVFKENKIKGIGISYQMHGLVCLDKDFKVLRKAIIWSDGRTKEIGNKLRKMVKENGLEENLLNYPGNFTISKLKWVQQNEPEIFNKIHKILLPGDYIALKLTGKCTTSQTGLSQCILWDFKNNCLCEKMLELAQISRQLIPQIFPSFSYQYQTTKQAQQQCMIPAGVSIMYRSGDQPNNAYALGVTQPGQISASGGTSGTVLLVSDSSQSLEMTKINTFLHCTHSAQNPRYAKLLCINSCGSIYSWLKRNFAQNKSYQEMNEIAESCLSDGLVILPFGNGQQRMLENKEMKASIRNIDLNRHGLKHIIRAALESIGFSFVYGIRILSCSQRQQLKITKIKASNDNIFNSSIVREIIQYLIGCEIQLVEGMTGAIGCAKGAKQTWEKLNEMKTNGECLKMKSQKSNHQVQTLKRQMQQHSKQKYSRMYQEWQKQLAQQMKELE